MKNKNIIKAAFKCTKLHQLMAFIILFKCFFFFETGNVY